MKNSVKFAPNYQTSKTSSDSASVTCKSSTSCDSAVIALSSDSLSSMLNFCDDLAQLLRLSSGIYEVLVRLLLSLLSFLETAEENLRKYIEC